MSDPGGGGDPGDSARTRTYGWDDPRVPAARLGARPGLEVLRAIAAGELGGAPIAATFDLSVRYLRPVSTASGMLRAEGTVVSLGRRVATAEGTVTDGRGRLVATGTTSCLVMDIAL